MSVAVLQSLLAAEHAAVYGYGVLGARLVDAERDLAQEADDAHRARRDALAALLRDAGAKVPAPSASYDVAVADRTAALALATGLEEGLSARWRDLVGDTDDAAQRLLGVDGLVETAVRATRWRAYAGRSPATVALPGRTA